MLIKVSKLAGFMRFCGMIVHIRENSWFARIAAKKLRAKKMAIVFGKTIHLFNTSREEFLGNEKWLTHELVHVQQFAKHGFFRFILLYLVESIRKGYRNNRFEAEARGKETDRDIISGFIIQ